MTRNRFRLFGRNESRLVPTSEIAARFGLDEPALPAPLKGLATHDLPGGCMYGAANRFNIAGMNSVTQSCPFGGRREPLDLACRAIPALGSGIAEARCDLDVYELALAQASAILVHSSRASGCGSFCTRHSVSIIIVARSAAV